MIQSTYKVTLDVKLSDAFVSLACSACSLLLYQRELTIDGPSVTEVIMHCAARHAHRCDGPPRPELPEDLRRKVGQL